MPNLPITQLPLTVTANTDSVIAIVNDTETQQISRNNFLINIADFSGNTDNLNASSMRTLYARSNVIEYSVGTDADLMSGSTNFGSRSFPTEFFSNSIKYSNKILYFGITGTWGTSDNTPDVSIVTKFGDDVLQTATISSLYTIGANGHPLEITGEVFFNNGQAICAYHIEWTAANGDYRKYSLGNPEIPVSITGFTGGDFKVIMSSTTTNSLTSYTGFVQLFN